MIRETSDNSFRRKEYSYAAVEKIRLNACAVLLAFTIAASEAVMFNRYAGGVLPMFCKSVTGVIDIYT